MTRKRTTAPSAASSRVVDDFKIIRGIGPLYEKHLHDAGIRTFAQLAKLSSEDVAIHLPNLSASQIRKQGWIIQARKLATKAVSKLRGKKSTVPTTRQHYENFTIEFLLNEKNKLRRLRIMHVQSGDVETWANWQTEEVSHFLARHSGTRIPEGKTQKAEAITAKPGSTSKKTKWAKSAKPKTIQSRSSKQISAKVAGKAAHKGISQKPESPMAPEIKKGSAKSLTRKTKQSRSKARKSVKPIVNTHPDEVHQKPDISTAPKVDQRQVKPAGSEPGQSKQLAPIQFRPAAEVLPKRFLQRSITSPVPEEIKHQAGSLKPEAPQSQIVRETNSQMGAIRLLQWNNFMADSDQPVQSLPYDQNFDVSLTLDISNLHIATKSQLEITGILLAKKLGSHKRRVISEAQVVIPYSPIINVCIGKTALEQGLYRLEAQIKLNNSETKEPTKSIYASLQGGLFQVY